MASNTNNKRRVFVIGVGMTKFEKPLLEWDYPDVCFSGHSFLVVLKGS